MANPDSRSRDSRGMSVVVLYGPEPEAPEPADGGVGGVGERDGEDLVGFGERVAVDGDRYGGVGDAGREGECARRGRVVAGCGGSVVQGGPLHRHRQRRDRRQHDGNIQRLGSRVPFDDRRAAGHDHRGRVVVLYGPEPEAPEPADGGVGGVGERDGEDLVGFGERVAVDGDRYGGVGDAGREGECARRGRVVAGCGGSVVQGGPLHRHRQRRDRRQHDGNIQRLGSRVPFDDRRAAGHDHRGRVVVLYGPEPEAPEPADGGVGGVGERDGEDLVGFGERVAVDGDRYGGVGDAGREGECARRGRVVAGCGGSVVQGGPLHRHRQRRDRRQHDGNIQRLGSRVPFDDRRAAGHDHRGRVVVLYGPEPEAPEPADGGVGGVGERDGEDLVGFGERVAVDGDRYGGVGDAGREGECARRGRVVAGCGGSVVQGGPLHRHRQRRDRRQHDGNIQRLGSRVPFDDRRAAGHDHRGRVVVLYGPEPEAPEPADGGVGGVGERDGEDLVGFGERVAVDGDRYGGVGDAGREGECARRGRVVAGCGGSVVQGGPLHRHRQRRDRRQHDGNIQRLGSRVPFDDRRAAGHDHRGRVVVLYGPEPEAPEPADGGVGGVGERDGEDLVGFGERVAVDGDRYGGVGDAGREGECARRGRVVAGCGGSVVQGGPLHRHRQRRDRRQHDGNIQRLGSRVPFDDRRAAGHDHRGRVVVLYGPEPEAPEPADGGVGGVGERDGEDLVGFGERVAVDGDRYGGVGDAGREGECARRGRVVAGCGGSVVQGGPLHRHRQRRDRRQHDGNIQRLGSRVPFDDRRAAGHDHRGRVVVLYGPEPEAPEPADGGVGGVGERDGEDLVGFGERVAVDGDRYGGVGDAGREGECARRGRVVAGCGGSVVQGGPLHRHRQRRDRRQHDGNIQRLGSRVPFDDRRAAGHDHRGRVVVLYGPEPEAPEPADGGVGGVGERDGEDLVGFGERVAVDGDRYGGVGDAGREGECARRGRVVAGCGGSVVQGGPLHRHRQRRDRRQHDGNIQRLGSRVPFDDRRAAGHDHRGRVVVLYGPEPEAPEPADGGVGGVGERDGEDLVGFGERVAVDGDRYGGVGDAGREGECARRGRVVAGCGGSVVQGGPLHRHRQRRDRRQHDGNIQRLGSRVPFDDRRAAGHDHRGRVVVLYGPEPEAPEPADGGVGGVGERDGEDLVGFGERVAVDGDRYGGVGDAGREGECARRGRVVAGCGGSVVQGGPLHRHRQRRDRRQHDGNIQRLGSRVPFDDRRAAGHDHRGRVVVLYGPEPEAPEPADGGVGGVGERDGEDLVGFGERVAVDGDRYGGVGDAGREGECARRGRVVAGCGGSVVQGGPLHHHRQRVVVLYGPEPEAPEPADGGVGGVGERGGEDLVGFGERVAVDGDRYGGVGDAGREGECARRGRVVAGCGGSVVQGGPLHRHRQRRDRRQHDGNIQRLGSRVPFDDRRAAGHDHRGRVVVLYGPEPEAPEPADGGVGGVGASDGADLSG